MNVNYIYTDLLIVNKSGKKNRSPRKKHPKTGNQVKKTTSSYGIQLRKLGHLFWKYKLLTRM